MDQFFYSTQIYDDSIILPEDEALHVLKVLRKKAGDQIMVVDGRGNLYYTSIDSENIPDCLCIIVARIHFSTTRYRAAIAITPIGIYTTSCSI